MKPKLNKIFNEEGLKITIDPAIQVTDYLDVKLNFSKHSHKPYRIPNDCPLYVNVNFNLITPRTRLPTFQRHSLNGYLFYPPMRPLLRRTDHGTRRFYGNKDILAI